MSDQRVSDASGNAKRIAGSFTASTITILTETRCKTPWINNPVTGRASAVAGGAGVADLAGVAELAGHTADHSAVHGAVGRPLPVRRGARTWAPGHARRSNLGLTSDRNRHTPSPPRSLCPSRKASTSFP